MNNTLKLSFTKPSNWSSLPLFLKIKYYSTILDNNYAKYVDKLEAKKIVSDMTNGEVKVAKIIKELNDFNDINEKDINNDHILKAVHGSGWNLDFNDIKNIFDIKKFIKDRTKCYSSKEKQYKYIKPRFFIEEKINDLHTGKSGKAFSYMFRCINGKPVTIGVKYEIIIYDNIHGWKKIYVNRLYDTNWNIIQEHNIDLLCKNLKLYNVTKIINLSPIINKPHRLDDMLKYATILSSTFEFVRIDFYIDKNNDIYFSEFTFTPASGIQKFDYKIEQALGKLWI
jgi:hypothetical protein